MMRKQPLLPRPVRERLFLSGALILAIVFVLFVLLPAPVFGASEQSPSILPPITWKEVQKVLDGRSFKSHEELLQLLYLLYHERQNQAFSIEKGTLAHLKNKITTLFPIEGCRDIELWGKYAIFKFDGPQDIFIPHTWLQASLQVSKRLVLKINDKGSDRKQSLSPFTRDPDTNTVAFTVKYGYLRLHFSFLLKLFGGRLRDADGTRLLYQINDKKKLSRLWLEEVTPLSSDSLKFIGSTRDRHDGKIAWIDIVHPDFPSHKDIGIMDNGLIFLGTKIELLPGKRIRIGKKAAIKNEKTWDLFSDYLKSFRKYATSKNTPYRLDYVRRFGYYLEERKIVMTMGFESPAHDRTANR